MLALVLASFLAWLGLLAFRGGFWRSDQFLPDPQDLKSWPSVAVVIPARNEAQTVKEVVSSLLDQDYPGGLHVVVVDDGSHDGTTKAALAASDDPSRLSVIKGKPLKEGWTGKLWAVAQGLQPHQK